MKIDQLAKQTHRRGVLAAIAGLLALPLTTRAQVVPVTCSPRGGGCTLLIPCCGRVRCIQTSPYNPNSGVCGGVLRDTSSGPAFISPTSGGSGIGGADTCDLSYPDFCLPPATGDTLNCIDIPYRNFRVRNPDPHNFDDDDDGIGCEE